MKIPLILLTAAIGTALGSARAAERLPLPEKIFCAVADRQDFQEPNRVHLKGWMGTRIDANEKNRLVKLDPATLLESYRNRRGDGSWNGEHVGKWLHAATLAWVNTGDEELRKKLDFIAAELVKCQLEDGYLGTYTDDKRWTAWDVWAHKYNLLGLITYIRYTGNESLLPACRKMGDLFCNTIGDEPGKRDINKSGLGTGPNSVLEPMVLLYRLTGEPRYLEFCNYLMRALEQPKGPQIVSSLLAGKAVGHVANGKAYEMISCLNGLLELYRTTGDPKLLQVCLKAWQSILDTGLYITGGGGGDQEYFTKDENLPNGTDQCENCVTVTWLQFNAQLLRLTGEVRFAEQLERVVLNQLLGAQKPDATGWSYFTPMENSSKSYGTNIIGSCCLSSGPRGIALIPTFAASVDADGVVVNLYEAGTANLKLRNGKGVVLTTATLYPSDGKIVIGVEPESAEPFAFKARIPAWCKEPSVKLNGQAVNPKIGDDGYATVKRVWAQGDKVELDFKLKPRVIAGKYNNAEKVAIMYGPLVLAADQTLLGRSDVLISRVGVASADLAALAIAPTAAPKRFQTWPHAQVFHLNAVMHSASATAKAGEAMNIELIPFADAGSAGNSYKIWLPLPSCPTDSPLADGKASQSRQGKQKGSINQENHKCQVNTDDGQNAEEDWYAVTLAVPIKVSRVAFTHGMIEHNGGWFDTSGGKPRIEIQTRQDGPWKEAGKLQDYPASTATNPIKFASHPPYTYLCQLAAPVMVYGVRVLGKPACGDQPGQAFSSCGGLQAFEK